MNLVRSFNGAFFVNYSGENNKYVRESFASIDEACDFMQDFLLMDEDEIDAGVIAINVNPSHDWAFFNDQGKFVRSGSN